MESTPSPLPPGLAGYTGRPVRPEDAPAVRRLLRVCDLAPGASGATYTREGGPSIERVLAGHGGSAPTTDTLCAADAPGRLAAVAWARVPPGVRHQYRGLLLGAVLPAHRRRGLGTSLLRWGEARARALLAGLPDDREKVLRIEFPGGRDDAGPVYARQGFRLGHVELEMDGTCAPPCPRASCPMSWRWSPGRRSAPGGSTPPAGTPSAPDPAPGCGRRTSG